MASDTRTVEELLLKLQEAEQKAQESEKRAQESEKRVQESEKRVQESEKRAQDEQKICQEAEKRAHESEKKAQEIQRDLQLAGEKARGLSLFEALSLWHKLFSQPKIRYRYETVQTSDFTSSIGRHHPKRLVHWTNFHNEHKSAFSLICNEFAKSEAGVFKSREFYQDDAERFMSHCLLDDEVALVAYEQRTVEELVINVWQQKGGNKIGFKSRQDHSLDDVTLRLEQMNTRETTMSSPIDKKKRLYDKVCYIIVQNGRCRDLFVIEYKSADKLTSALVLKGMHDMELDGIIHQVKISTDKVTKEKEKAEKAIAIVVTQTYDYMIDQGLCYGYVNGGKSFIFLFVHPEDPQTVYYEKIILEDPFTTSSIVPCENLRLTAVGLVAGFAQMALSKQPWDEATQKNARNKLPTWVVDDGKILDSMTPLKTPKSIKDSPAFKEPDNHHSFPDTSPSQTRSKTKAKKDLAYCQKSENVLPRLRKDDDDSSGTKSHPRLGVAKPGFIQSASKSGQNTTTESNGKGGSSKTNGKNKVAATTLKTFDDYQANTAMPDRLYCTQACLLGLIRGYTLDKKCPNVNTHRKKAQYYSRNSTVSTFKSRQQRNNRHAINQPAFARLIDQQLQGPRRNFDGGFESLDRSGWAGALFCLELLSHGYTFVAKGTVQSLVPVLEFEANMYKRMNTIQGKAIPVYLGSVNLASAFHLTTKTAIIHLMLLSWAGEEAWKCKIEPERLWLETIRTHHEVAALGVQQGDLRPPNVLWNNELDRAILIDFEYAHIEREQEKIGLTIAKKTKAKRKIKVLGQTSGNRASHQARVKNN